MTDSEGVSSVRAGARRVGRPAGPVVLLLTVQEVARRLSVPEKTVFDWTYKLCALDSKPLLPTKRLGRRVRVPESALDELPLRLEHREPGAFSFFSGEGSKR